MTDLFSLLLGWMPLPLALICSGVFSFFVFTSVLHLIAFILDIIPFA